MFFSAAVHWLLKQNLPITKSTNDFMLITMIFVLFVCSTKEKEDWENVGAHRSSIKPVTCSEDKVSGNSSWEIFSSVLGSYLYVLLIQNYVFIQMVQEIKDDNHSLGKSIKHFKCPAAVRIMHLKKLIQLKYNVDTKHKVSLSLRFFCLKISYCSVVCSSDLVLSRFPNSTRGIDR